MRNLPMLGLTHGNRSAVTCHLKCDSACARPAPNSSCEPSFQSIASAALSRRTLLAGGGVLAAAVAMPVVHAQGAEAAASGTWATPSPLRFTPIESVEATVDAFTVPKGFRWDPIIRWGDPLFENSPEFDPTKPDAKAQALQFGYNNDYLDIIETNKRGTEALLVCNHEYTNRQIMFPPTTSEAEEAEVLRTLKAAHGMAVVELERRRRGEKWEYVRGAKNNRRITADTPFLIDGPAAGSALLKTKDDPEGVLALGTFGNCAGGTTPWGTVLSGEENFNGYFVADPAARGSKRYGLTNTPSSYGWEKVDPRFDATKAGYANEPHRFGWIVEIDPTDPKSTPVKHTAMGRMKHEGANVRVDSDGTVVAYMGDDERFDYLYKFVAKNKFRKGDSRAARKHNLKLLSEGDLYVAKFTGEMRQDNANLGSGTWIPLTKDGKSAVPGFTLDEVLVFTREAADAVKATPMDRCEDVQPSLKSGKVYVACTNNTNRGADGKPAPDAANPVKGNKNGHIIEITERKNKADATKFEWNLFMVCGDTDEAGTYFAGWDGPVAPISCPDNVAFDSAGNLWISTDGQPGTISKNDGLFRVPVAGKERGHLVQFLAVPVEAETCGPVVHDKDGSVFVAVQHPGENGTWAAQHSYFPDYVKDGQKPGKGDWRGPRPSVVQITRK
ncbi:PhoX family phosphatase [Kineosporia rhizophila]|uniref:PhoX family protein n=1 Tax=Kineosporia rhizophila TaxID=84633 RepID=UPI001E523D09|nr:PhoX family phosphatase [Kineosporia rhizophila]MCE0537204.1 PhoX family phosphatase [Kineosporia rhizophila]